MPHSRPTAIAAKVCCHSCMHAHAIHMSVEEGSLRVILKKQKRRSYRQLQMLPTRKCVLDACH
jgi:hypothetical protein